MNRSTLLVCGLALTIAAGLAMPVRGEPIAPPVPVPANGGELRPWEADALRRLQVPSAAEVGIPAYPGAMVVQAQPGGEMTINDERHRYNPTVMLLTGDSEAQVAEFYRAELEGWNHERMMGMTWFWDSEDAYHPADIEAIGEVRAVGIMPPGPLGRVMPDAQVMIEIRYTPSD